MTLSITKVDQDTYQATVTPPHSAQAWSTLQPISANQLTKELLRQGCHQQDIGDAFYAADPTWLIKTR